MQPSFADGSFPWPKLATLVVPRLSSLVRAVRPTAIGHTAAPPSYDRAA